MIQTSYLLVLLCSFCTLPLAACFINPHVITVHSPISIQNKQQDFFSSLVVLFSHSDKGFNKKGNLCALGKSIFNRDLFLRDVYLASRLSEAGLLVGDPSQPYGGIPEEQFIGMLAPTQLLFLAEQRQVCAIFSLMHQPKFLQHSDWQGVLGTNICFMKRMRLLNLDIYGGCPGVGNILGEDNIRQYFSKYNVDFTDFFRRAVLDPKKIIWERYQSIYGIRSCDFFGEIVYGIPNFLRPLHRVLIGFDLEITPGPLGGEQNRECLWSAAINNDWKYTSKLFGACFFQSSMDFFNPYMFVSFEKKWSTATKIRCAQEKNQNSCVIRSAPFNALQVAPFNLPDALIPDFADRDFSVLIEPKISFRTVLCNTIHNIFDTAWSAIVGLEYNKKRAPRIRINSTPENPLFLGDVMSSYRHSSTKLFCTIQIPQSEQITCNFGCNITLFGTNMIKKSELFCSFSAAF